MIIDARSSRSTASPPTGPSTPASTRCMHEPAGDRLAGRHHPGRSGELPAARMTPPTGPNPACSAALRDAGSSPWRQGYHGYDDTGRRAYHPVQRPQQAGIPERRQPRPRPPARTRRTRQRPTQNLRILRKLRCCPHRAGRPQGHPRATEATRSPQDENGSCRLAGHGSSPGR